MFACLVVVFCLSGCDKHGFVQSGGKITFEDGSPVTKGSIAFSTANFQADGTIQSDGTYILSSLKKGDGLPPGHYKVTVNSFETNDKEQMVYLVDPKFSDPAQSGLSAEVTKGGKNQFDFKVTKPAK